MRIKPDQPAIQPQATEIKSNSPQQIQAEKTNLGIASTWDTFVSQQAQSGGAVDPNALVQDVLKQSYLQTTEDLKFYADKVKSFNEHKKLIRGYVQNSGDSDSPQKNEALKLVDQLKAGGNNNNLMEALTLTIKETIKDSNEDKKYYLQKMVSMNKISESLNAQMQSIAEASAGLAKAEKKDDDD
jgi:antitoxin component HigA of HigAB toxin-antitoxin module